MAKKRLFKKIFKKKKTSRHKLRYLAFKNTLKNLINLKEKIKVKPDDDHSPEFFKIFRLFCQKFFRIRYEFSYQELIKETKRKKISSESKSKLIKLAKQMSEKAFSNTEYSKPELLTHIIEFEDLLIMISIDVEEFNKTIKFQKRKKEKKESQYKRFFSSVKVISKHMLSKIHQKTGISKVDNLQRVYKLFGRGYEAIEKKDIKSARKIFLQINNLYTNLSEQEKQHFNDEIIAMQKEINLIEGTPGRVSKLDNVFKLFVKGYEALENSDLEKADEILHQIEELYKDMSSEEKEQIKNEISDLRKEIRNLGNKSKSTVDSLDKKSPEEAALESQGFIKFGSKGIKTPPSSIYSMNQPNVKSDSQLEVKSPSADKLLDIDLPTLPDKDSNLAEPIVPDENTSGIESGLSLGNEDKNLPVVVEESADLPMQIEVHQVGADTHVQLAIDKFEGHVSVEKPAPTHLKSEYVEKQIPEVPDSVPELKSQVIVDSKDKGELQSTERQMPKQKELPVIENKGDVKSKITSPGFDPNKSVGEPKVETKQDINSKIITETTSEKSGELAKEKIQESKMDVSDLQLEIIQKPGGVFKPAQDKKEIRKTKKKSRKLSTDDLEAMIHAVRNHIDSGDVSDAKTYYNRALNLKEKLKIKKADKKRIDYELMEIGVDLKLAGLTSS